MTGVIRNNGGAARCPTAPSCAPFDLSSENSDSPQGGSTFRSVLDARSDRRSLEGEGTDARKSFVFEGSDGHQGTTVAEDDENGGEGDKGAEGDDDRKGIEHAEGDHDVPDKAGQGGDQVREEVQHHVDDHELDDHAYDDNHDRLHPGKSWRAAHQAGVPTLTNVRERTDTTRSIAERFD